LQRLRPPPERKTWALALRKSMIPKSCGLFGIGHAIFEKRLASLLLQAEAILLSDAA
jgi:hypothetical protein